MWASKGVKSCLLKSICDLGASKDLDKAEQALWSHLISFCPNLTFRHRYRLDKYVWTAWSVQNIVFLVETRSDRFQEKTVICAVLFTAENICHWLEQSLSSLIKNGPYFLLVSCDCTVCSLWNISGGRKGGGSPPPSDKTLWWPVFVGLVAWHPVSTGISNGRTVRGQTERLVWWLTYTTKSSGYTLASCDLWPPGQTPS